jgi:hypothetical protein
MSKVAVPSLRKKTRKSQTVLPRAVVSQQTLVAIPVIMIVDAGGDGGSAQDRYREKRQKTRFFGENVPWVYG